MCALNFEQQQRLLHTSRGFSCKSHYGFQWTAHPRKGLVGAYAPVLPPEWKSMTLKKVSFRGQHYDITIDAMQRQVRLNAQGVVIAKGGKGIYEKQMLYACSLMVV